MCTLLSRNAHIYLNFMFVLYLGSVQTFWYSTVSTLTIEAIQKHKNGENFFNQFCFFLKG